MQALGLIETLGLLPAIECIDVMLKTAQVELVERTFVGGGLVAIVVTGDVGAVKAAVKAGTAAVQQIGHVSLVSQHVIPRPHDNIENMIVAHKNLAESQAKSLFQQQKSSIIPISDLTINSNHPSPSQAVEVESVDPIVTAKGSTHSAEVRLELLHKDDVDGFVQKFGLDKSMDVLKLLSVAKLRNLAREYKELDIAGRAISKANKDLLIRKLKGYYERGT